MIVDTHVHVIEPDRFPLVQGRGYHPQRHEWGTLGKLDEVLESNGVSHALLAQPSCYGSDNRALLEAICRASHGKRKGIAVVEPDADDAHLCDLKSRGVAGIRLNLLNDNPAVLSHPRLPRLLAISRELDWHIQIHASGRELLDALQLLQPSRLTVIVEHWGRPNVAAGPEYPDFRTFLRYGQLENFVIKLSAPYRISNSPDFSDLDPFAERLLQTFGLERCVWGSDWPFINTARRPNYAEMKASISRWLSANELQQVLWRTPAALFGFT
jgi:predicted TIM-barrel fold metal-dependent hydrolase